MGGVANYLALLLIITPMADFIANVAPLHPSDVHWRYGTVALLSGFLLTPLLGILIATVAAEWMDQVGLQWTLGILNAVAGVLMGLLLIAFIIDLLEVRHGVPANARLTFDVGSLKALAKHLLTLPLLFWFATVNLRFARAKRAQIRGSGSDHIASRVRGARSSSPEAGR